MINYTTYNICKHISGDTWDGLGSITFTANGSAIDLTGADVEFGVKYSIASPNVLTLNTKNSGLSIPSPLSGLVIIPPTLVDSPPGKYNWYLSIKFPDNRVKTYFKGIWEIIPPILESHSTGLIIAQIILSFISANILFFEIILYS
jgi:hypothetical protein